MSKKANSWLNGIWASHARPFGKKKGSKRRRSTWKEDVRRGREQ